MSDAMNTCSECGSGFKTAWDLKKHINVVHTKIFTEMCPICGETFSKYSMYKLKNHMAKNHGFKKDFKCDKCNGDFLSATGLETHKKTCGDKGKHGCTKCSKHFKKRRDLQSHYDVHAGQKTHQCEVCAGIFFHKTSLTRHKAVVHEKSFPFICETCSKSFSNKWGLKLHSKVHTGQSRFICSYCEKKYNDKRPFVLHLQTVHNKEYIRPEPEKQKMAECPEPVMLISEYFANPKHASKNETIVENVKVDDQIQGENSESIEPIESKCKLCSYKSKSSTKYKHHVFFRHGEGKHLVYELSSDSIYYCELCEFASAKLLALKKHFVGVHVNTADTDGKTEDEKCETNKDFKNSKIEFENLDCDIINGGEIKDTDIVFDSERIKDDIKEEEFEWMDMAIKDEPVFEETQKPMQEISEQWLSKSKLGEYSCEFEECGYKNINKNVIKRHVTGKHLNLRSFACEQCPYVAKSKMALRWHVSAIHENILHKCLECDFQSKWMTSLKGHVKTVHLGIKRKVGSKKQNCQDCDYTSDRKDVLTKHIKGKHSKEYFQCDACPFKSNWNHVLLRHVQCLHK